MKLGTTCVTIFCADGTVHRSKVPGIAETAEEEGEQMDATIAVACVKGLDVTGIKFSIPETPSAAQTD